MNRSGSWSSGSMAYQQTGIFTRLAKSTSNDVFPYPAGAETRMIFFSSKLSRISSKRGRERKSFLTRGTMIRVRVTGISRFIQPGFPVNDRRQLAFLLCCEILLAPARYTNTRVNITLPLQVAHASISHYSVMGFKYNYYSTAACIGARLFT